MSESNQITGAETMTIEMVEADPQKFCESFSHRIFKDIAAMSKEQLALILHGLACRAQLIEESWKFREAHFGRETYAESECPSFSRIFAAFSEYEMLSRLDDCGARLEAAERSKKQKTRWWARLLRAGIN